jgi:hypothetical protein
LGNILYFTPFNGTNISLTLTSFPTTSNATFNFAVIINSSSNKVYINSLTLNSTSVTLLYNGGSSSIPTLTSATAIIQTFNAINTSSGLWKVITSISAFY